MPSIRPSADLRNNYNEISAFCHENDEPVFITKNGKGDLAVMSIETYEMLCGKMELYNQINLGLKAAELEKVEELKDVIDEIRKNLN